MNTSRMRAGVVLAVVTALGLLSFPTLAAHPASAPAVQTTTSTTTYALNTMRSIPVHGAVATGQALTGKLNVVNFMNVNGRLMAIGYVSGTLRNAAGGIVGTVTHQRASFPVRLSDGTNVRTSSATAAAAACDILHLRLGAIDLNLLGLVVHLDPVRLDITAQPGPGNLLGNLLCAVTGLLDNTGVNDVLVHLLRAIRDILNGVA